VAYRIENILDTRNNQNTSVHAVMQQRRPNPNHHRKEFVMPKTPPIAVVPIPVLPIKLPAAMPWEKYVIDDAGVVWFTIYNADTGEWRDQFPIPDKDNAVPMQPGDP
jgi:hypothetical protein